MNHLLLKPADKNFFLTIVILIFYVLVYVSHSMANERYFTYVYQSNTLQKGEKEIEIWTTPRIGKNSGYFARMDNRVEFEAGITNSLQTAFYFNFKNTTRDNGAGVNETKFEFQGISSEWKYQVSSPYKTLGFALYGELGLNTDEVELETKLIFDKRIKNTTLALNVTLEPEWELTPGKPEYELKFENTFGISHSLSSNFSAGIEVRNHNVYTREEGWEHSALFAGPNIYYSQESWWVTFTVMPQILAFKNKSPDSNLDLSEYEKLEARMIFSIHL